MTLQAQEEMNAKKNVFFEIDREEIIEILRTLGWSAKAGNSPDQPDIVSAVNGVNFNVRFGTPGRAGCLDFTIFATFDIDAEITPTLGANWNRLQRFARAYRTVKHLVMDMDVVVAHGVSRAHIRHNFLIWADMIRLFLQHLNADRAAFVKRTAQARVGKADGGKVTGEERSRAEEKPLRARSASGGKLTTAT